MKTLMIAALLGAAVVTGGCKKEETAPAASNPSTPTPGTATSAGGAASSSASKPHNRVPLGETTLNGLKLVATQDEPVKPGGEGAFDLVITGGKPKAVRFWVGTETAEGSVKAKAEEETADHWHTHAEVPDPLPAGSRFWVEVEPQSGPPFKASFDLKVQ